MLPFLAPFLQNLLQSGLGLVANAVLSKGKEFIKEKTGVDVEQASLSAEDKLKLLQFQAEHEEELLRLQLENNRLAFEETKAYLADVSSARSTQAAIQTSADAPLFVKLVQPGLAVFVVLATVVLFALFVQWTGDIPRLDANGKPLLGSDGTPLLQTALNGTQKDIVIYILGVLSAAVTQILGYYFGSSQGSKEKSKTLDSALLQKAEREAK